MKQIIDDAVGALLADIGSTHDALLEVVQRVRHVAAAAGDGVSESVKYGGIMFSHTAFFCGVFAYSGHVTVEFGRGICSKTTTECWRAAVSIAGISSFIRLPMSRQNSWRTTSGRPTSWNLHAESCMHLRHFKG